MLGVSNFRAELFGLQSWNVSCCISSTWKMKMMILCRPLTQRETSGMTFFRTAATLKVFHEPSTLGPCSYLLETSTSASVLAEYLFKFFDLSFCVHFIWLETQENNNNVWYYCAQKTLYVNCDVVRLLILSIVCYKKQDIGKKTIEPIREVCLSQFQFISF